MPKTVPKNKSQTNLIIRVSVVLGCLLAMYITGVAMTSLGLPNKAAVAGNTLWHVLFTIHMGFLITMVLTALSLVYTAMTKMHSLRIRAILGVLVMIGAAVSGSLSFNGVDKSFTLFLVGMAVLVLAFIYVPVLIKFKAK